MLIFYMRRWSCTSGGIVSPQNHLITSYIYRFVENYCVCFCWKFKKLETPYLVCEASHLSCYKLHKWPGDAANLADAIRRLERCIQEIRIWMTANKLKLNDGKTDFMVIVSAYYRQLINSLEIAIKVGNTNIHPTMSVKNLEVTLDTNMTMHQHVNQFVRTAYFHPRPISRIRRFIN